LAEAEEASEVRPRREPQASPERRGQRRAALLVSQLPRVFLSDPLVARASRRELVSLWELLLAAQACPPRRALIPLPGVWTAAAVCPEVRFPFPSELPLAARQSASSGFRRPKI